MIWIPREISRIGIEAKQGRPILLAVSFPNVSYPGPDRSIRLADLETGHFVARRYRNRRIGEFLKELKLTEGRGTGIPKILKAMKANRSPKPQFETDDGRTYFIATFPIHVQGKIKRKQGQARVTGEVAGEVLKYLAILRGC